MKKSKKVDVDPEATAKATTLEAEKLNALNNMATNTLINQMFGKEASATAFKYVSTSGSSGYTSSLPDLSSVCSSGSSVPYSPMYKPLNMVHVDDIVVGGKSILGLIQLLGEHVAKEKSNVANTNLELVRAFSAEELAEFIVHTSRHYVSGSGDTVAELTAWLNSNVE